MGVNEGSNKIKEVREEMNIYESPENYGLEIVVSDDCARSYEFDIYVIFRDKEGNHYYAHDEGCSCPTPFDDFTKIEHLTPIMEFDDFKSVIMAWDRATLEDRLTLVSKTKDSIDSFKKEARC